ncbi:MAG: IS66 family insertion sequence element accessory protein TnpB [Bdellovibrionales bacterium]|nr:IS66 family insertion sequence element accessory protein TnpB [Bdellovibrionales bacterium]
MRFGIERLSFLVKEEMGEDVNYGDLFLFLGFNRKRLKGLFFDGSGLLLMTKRMEKKRFMSVNDLSRFSLTRSELKLILHGSVLRDYAPSKRISS